MTPLRRDLPLVARRAGVRVLDGLDARLRQDLPLPEAMARLLVEVQLALRQEEALARRLRESIAIGRTTDTEEAAVAEALTHLSQGRALAEDLKALSRELDGEAVEDRLIQRGHLAGQGWEFLATALAARDLTGLDDDLMLAVRDGALELLDQPRPWSVQRAACALVGACARRDLPGRGSARQRLLSLSWDRRADPWVQAAALQAWLDLRGGEPHEPVLRGVLLPDQRAQLPEGHRFVRARAAGLAATHRRWGLLREALDQPDDSEHVRGSVAEALARSPREEDREALCRWIAAQPEDLRVSARAALALLDQGHPEGVEQALSAGRPALALHVLRGVMERRRALPLEVVARARWDEALRAWSPEVGDVGELAAALRLWIQVRQEPALHGALELLEAWLDGSPEGQARSFRGDALGALAPAALLDVLALAAHDRFDLGADPIPGGWRVQHGVMPRPALWRLLHELRHPRTDKRQAHSHVTDRVPRHALLAPSARMAEVTPTLVPGQKVATPETLSWDAQLPLPAHLLGAALRGETWVRTASHSYRLSSASPRRTALRLSLRYPELASLRDRLRAAPPARARDDWDKAAASLGLRIERKLGPALALLDLDSLTNDLLAADANTVEQLALLSGALGVFWIGRNLWRRRRDDRWREAIPLVIGGWGSRGKSGTERLKAAVFQGLGYHVLSKTTGSEAMVVAALPGRDPLEIFLYRPYDKATIVEQGRVMELAAGIGAQVFLWECMALNPYYVEILQGDQVRDDFTTLTNTYPDHEDIQGPSGRDVADVIARMLPRRGHAITTEQHMTPVLRDAALRRETSLEVCRYEESELLPRDLLARLPYDEHPRNIALVVRLAAALGIEADVALKAMGDHALPDVGVLKEYGPVQYEEREISFINGMAANERAGFMSNWIRTGMGRREARSGLTACTAVVVNNRGDRLARQAVFARIAALDAVADALVVIGTSVGPFLEQLDHNLNTLLRDQLRDAAKEGLRPLAHAIAARLGRAPLPLEEARAVLREQRYEADAIVQTASLQGVRLDALSRTLVRAPLGFGPRTQGEAGLQWLVETVWLHLLSTQEGWSMDAAIDGAVACLLARVRPLHDAGLTGDQVVHAIATTAPPGASLRMLGSSNIKGTGLGFVYRWLSIQKTLERGAALESDRSAEAWQALSTLAAEPALGVADTLHALTRIAVLRESGHFARLGLLEEATSTADRLEGLLRVRRAALGSSAEVSRRDQVVHWLHAALDFHDSAQRRREVDRLYRDLAARRVGQGRSSQIAQALVYRQKKRNE